MLLMSMCFGDDEKVNRKNVKLKRTTFFPLLFFLGKERTADIQRHYYEQRDDNNALVHTILLYPYLNNM